ncbi:MAG TPA: LLM class flavin-dependent oxidoreductase [Acidimicrobiales bacterium]|nr:LLM class flavin-dependent oxidoreductase [Acidimicrobiales bacterium]
MRTRPLHVGVQLQGQNTSWADYARAVRAVEDLGFGSVWTFDHVLPFSGPDDGACFETLTTMGAWAVLTNRTRVGVLVNGVLYRDPAVLAKAAAQVDQITGGRLEFSLGAAWAEREFRAYGWPFPSVSERYERLDEALDLIKQLWAQHRTTFVGKYYRVLDAPCEPKPVQSPHPPITVGGTGLGSLKVAARHGQRLNMVGPPATCATTIAKLREVCAQLGRDFDGIELSAHPNLVLAPTAAAAEEAAVAVAASHGTDLAAARDGWLIGGPAEVVTKMRAYTDLGINHFVVALGYPFDTASLRLLRDEVLPAVAA